MSGSDVVRIGCLCTAAIARKNCLAIHQADGVELTLVGSRDVRKAQSFIDALKEHGCAGNARAVGSYDDVISSEHVDCVYIPLPTGLHKEWVVKAAARGKHILLEKPVALSTADLDAMLLAVGKAGVQLLDGTMWVHNPRTKHMRQILDSPSLGDLCRINASLSFRASDSFLEGNIRTQPALDGLGCLGDLGWYCVRAMLWATGYKPPTRVVGSPLHKVNARGVLTSCSGSLEFPGGVFASFDCAFDTPLRSRLEVAGSAGTLLCDDWMIPRDPEKCPFVQTSEHGLSALDLAVATKSFEHSVTAPKCQEALMWEEMADCVRAVRAGGQPRTHWLRAAELTQRVLLALQHSLAEGGKVVDFVQWAASH